MMEEKKRLCLFVDRLLFVKKKRKGRGVEEAERAKSRDQGERKEQKK